VPGKQHEDVAVGVVKVVTAGRRTKGLELHLRTEQRDPAESRFLRRCRCVLPHERHDLPAVPLPAMLPRGLPGHVAALAARRMLVAA